jgi:hypothetical protein
MRKKIVKIGCISSKTLRNKGQRTNRTVPFAHDTSVAIAPLSLSGAYNMIYLAHFVRPNFCLSAKTQIYQRTLYEIMGAGEHAI